jgi:hypothetical protein
MIKPIKQKRCKSCKELFKPANSLILVCGMACALDYGKAVVKVRKTKAIKEYNEVTRKMKREANDKDKSFWMKKAQQKFNEYIRKRDEMKPCISCQTTKTVKYDAGHYVPVGRSSALRFNEFNCHKQCSSYCNVHLSGNLIAYRSALVEIYGQEKVLWLEGVHEMPNYRLDDYKNVYALYTKKLKELNEANQQS